jgi:3-oxoacyl-[acyl-carrier protein] reductase
MAKAIAAENVGRGITVNCVLPGLIATPKVEAMPEEIVERFRAAGALGVGRLGEPSEVAALVAYLASEEAGYVTGQEIAIAGGSELLQVSLGASRER